MKRCFTVFPDHSIGGGSTPTRVQLFTIHKFSSWLSTADLPTRTDRSLLLDKVREDKIGDFINDPFLNLEAFLRGQGQSSSLLSLQLLTLIVFLLLIMMGFHSFCSRS